MANPLKGEIEVVVGDETFKLALDINGLIEIEDALGIDLSGILAGLQSISLKVDRAILWQGMQAHHAPCNLLRAGEIVQQLGFQEAHAAVIRLMAATMPEVVREKPKNPRKAAGQDGTGKNS